MFIRLLLFLFVLLVGALVYMGYYHLDLLNQYFSAIARGEWLV